MKKISLSIVILLSLVTAGNAQNTSPYWSLAGNNNATPASKLGTTNDISLRFYTNNVQRMIINSAAGLVGIGTPAPNSKLHVNSIAGEHAIRAQVNGITKFLVHLNGGVVIGGTLAPPVNGLYVSGNVGIGTSLPSYKLHVVNSGTAIYGSSTGGGNGVYGFGGATGIGVRGLSDNEGVYGDGDTYGVHGFSGTGKGVYGQSGSGRGVEGYSNDSYGGFFQSFSSDGVYGTGQVGVRGVCSKGGGDGVFGYTTGTGSYGVHGYSENSYGIYGLTGNVNSYAGFFSGKVFSTGGYTSSDRKLKQDITDVTNAMDIIKKLQPKYYNFRQDGNYKFMNLPQGKHYGLIAQDVEQVLPNLVADAEFNTAKLPDPKEQNVPVAVKPGQTNVGSVSNPAVKEKKTEIISFKTMNYTELIPILVKGMQEQQIQIEKLTANNEALQTEIDELKSVISKPNNGTSVTSVKGYLKQNSPNPFNTNTVISYYVPDNAGYAQIKITDVKGSVIKTFNAKGGGQINIRAGLLPAGTYNYTLYINDKTVDSKQMVLLK